MANKVLILSASASAGAGPGRAALGFATSPGAAPNPGR